MGRGRTVAFWGAMLALVLVAHGAVGFAWLSRSLPAPEFGGATEPAFDLDLDRDLVEAASVEGAASPALEPAPEVPEPEVPPAAAASPSDPLPPPQLEAVAPPPLPDMPRTEPTVPTRRGTAPARPPAREPSPAERARERERADARREAAEEGRRRAAAARQGRAAVAAQPAPSGRAAAPAAAPAASTAASAAWRSQIVGILRGRFAGGSSGMASVTFSVGRGGQIGGARLTASSGDARLDAAALAVFRGAVPAPPAGYVGPLTFNIRLGVR